MTQPTRSTSGLAAILASILVLTSQSACSTRPESPEKGVVPAPQTPTTEPAGFQYPTQAYHDRTDNIRDPEFVSLHVDEISSFDVVILGLKKVFTPEGADFVAQLRSRNPDIIVLGVQQVLGRHDAWNRADLRPEYPMAAEMYDLLSPHLLYQMSGEPAMMWETNQMIDPTDGSGDLDRDLLREYVDIIARHAQDYPTAIDGIMHDYMSPSPWLYPDGSVEGTTADVDLDGDGIGSTEDDDDRRLWTAWQKELMREFQDRFGEGFINVANGALGIRDEEAASLMAGILYQHFPRTPWGYTDLEGLEMAFDHAQDRLTPRRGRVWSILDAETGRRAGDVEFRRVASLLTGLPYVWRLGQWREFFGREDLDMDLGAPIGEATRERLENGGVRYERVFENGIAAAEFDEAGIQQGLTVQSR